MSRWCKVIADRFDYVAGPTQMISGQKGDILYLPERVLVAGTAANKLERIARPAGYKVDKKGRVVCSRI